VAGPFSAVNHIGFVVRNLEEGARFFTEVLGFESVTERTGTTVVDPSVHDIRDLVERGVRTRLGPERWVQAHAAGRRSTIDSLLTDIDRVLAQK